MPRTVTGVDIGTRANKFLRGTFKGNTFHASAYSFAEHAPSDVAGGWSAGEPSFKLETSRVGVTGREVNLRYTRVPQVPDWQLKKLMRFEVEEIGGQSGSGVASDFNLLPPLPEIEGEDVVLLAMARESLLEAHLEGLKRLGGTLDAFTPNAVALYNAWLRFGVVGQRTHAFETDRSIDRGLLLGVSFEHLTGTVYWFNPDDPDDDYVTLSVGFAF